jgi:hypothetical protein
MPKKPIDLPRNGDAASAHLIESLRANYRYRTRYIMYHAEEAIELPRSYRIPKKLSNSQEAIELP